MPDTEPGPAREPEFFRQVLDDGAGAAARRKPKQPWWLPAGPERYHARIGGLYIILALAALVASFFGAPAPVAWMFAGWWLLMGSWYFLSRVALRKRARRGTQATRNPGGPSRAGGREARP